MISNESTSTYYTGEVQLLRYQYSNHLGTASLELDDAGAIISYEEYYPFGSTSFQSGRSAAEGSLKRYRYTSKERDEETGLYYHGARYYAPWLARWCASDPLESKYAGMSAYSYGFNNPITWQDSTGMGPDVKVQNPDGPGSPTNPAQLAEVVVMAQKTPDSAVRPPPMAGQAQRSLKSNPSPLTAAFYNLKIFRSLPG